MRGLQQGLRDARTELSAYASEVYNATLGVDVSGVTSAIRQASAQAQSWEGETFASTLAADGSEVRRDVGAAQQLAERFARQTYEALLGVDSSEVRTDVSAAEQLAQRFAHQAYNATLGVDASDVRTEVTQAQQLASRFAGQTYTASLGVRGTAQTLAELSAVEREARSLDGRDVNVDVDTDSSAISSLSSSFAGLASQIRAVGTVLAAASIPFTIAGIAAAIPSVVALTASLGGLASVLGSGVVGAAVAATGAIAAFGGAFALVAPPVAMLVGTLKEYDQAQSTIQSQQQAAIASSQQLADAQRAEAQARQNVAQVASDGARQIRAAEAEVRTARQEGAQNVVEQERALDEARRAGAQNILEQERQLSTTRIEGIHSVQDQERAVAEARRSARAQEEEQEEALAQVRRDAVKSVTEQERVLRDTRRQVAQNNAQAEGELEAARDQLTSSTRSLVAAQNELNRAQRTEPLRQAQLTLDLASARDRASDAARASAKAIREYGRNSEEARDALREQEQAELDLKVTRDEVNRGRRQGTDELQGAKDAARAAREEQQSAAQAEIAAQENVNRTRREGQRQVQQQSRTLIQTQREATRTVREQQEALAEARTEGNRQVTEQARLLKRTQQDALRSVREQQRALQQTRAEARRDESEQEREVQQARKDSLKQQRQAEQALAETRRQVFRQNQAAQQQLAQTMRATARAAEALRQSQKGLKEETVKLTPAQKALYKEYQRFSRLADTAFQPAQDAAARLGVEILRLGEQKLPTLARTSKQTVDAVSGVFDTLSRELAKPVEQAGLTRYLELIPKFTRIAGDAVVRFGLGFFNVFSRSLKFVLPVTKAIDDLSKSFLKWTRSAEGESSVDRVLAGTMRRAEQLFGVLKDLGRGVGNIFDAINRSGLDDQAMRGLEDLAAGFARVTTKGSEGRKNLNAFLKDAKELMPFVGGALVELASQFGRVISKVIDFREKGHRLTTLQEIFRGIKRSAGPMADLLIGTFEDLGPEIAKLIPRMTEFLATFAGSSGPLVTFTKTLNDALKIFNNLPDPIKRTAANAAALYLIMKPFGGPAIVGGLADIIGKYVQWRIVVGLLNKKLLETPPTVTTAPAVGPAVQSTWKGRLGGMLAKLGAFTILATVAIVGLQKNIEHVRTNLGPRWARAFSESIKAPLSKGAIEARRELLKSFFEAPVTPFFIRWFKRPVLAWFDRTAKDYKKPASGVGDKIRAGIIEALKPIPKAMRAVPLVSTLVDILDRMIRRGEKKAQEGQRIGKTVSERLADGLRSVPIIAPFLRILDSLFGRSKRKVEGQRWKPIGDGAAGDILDGFLSGGLIGGALDLVEAWFTKSKAKTDQHRWKPIGDSAVGEILYGFTTGGLIAGAIDLIGRWFTRAKDKQSSQDWRGIGLAAAVPIALGFKAGGIVGTVGEVLTNAAAKGKDQTPKFENCGKDSAQGYVRGFSAVDIGKLLVRKVKGGWEEVAKWGQGRSPWRRTMQMGLDAIKGFALGLLRDGGLAERNAKTLAGRVAKAIRDGVVDLGDVPRAVWDQLLKRGWVGDPADNRERLMAPQQRVGLVSPALTPLQRAQERQRLEGQNAFGLTPIVPQGRPVREWDFGTPRDMVSTILNSNPETLGKSWAKYLVHHLSRLPDKFRFGRRADIERLAPRLRQLGFSGFEDLTFVRNQRMRRFQRGVGRDALGTQDPQGTRSQDQLERLRERTVRLAQVLNLTRQIADVETRRASIVRDRSRLQAVGRRDGTGGGDRGITPAEIEQAFSRALEKNNAKLLGAIRQAAKSTQFTPQWWGAFDGAAGEYLGHRNAMRPDAR